MKEHYFPYIPLLIGTVVVLGGVLTIFLLNALLGPKRKNPNKGKPFECGNPEQFSAKRRFSVKFYIIAMFFIIFDIEGVFLIPWAVIFKDVLKIKGLFPIVFLIEMFLFILILVVGLVYVWKKGALKVEK